MVWARMIATVRGVVCSQLAMFVTFYILLSSVGFVFLFFVFLDRQCGLVVQSLKDREGCIKTHIECSPSFPVLPTPMHAEALCPVGFQCFKKKRKN